MRGELFYSCVIGFASGVLLRSFFIFSVDAVGTLIAIGIVAFLLIHRWMPVLKIYGISFLIFSLAFACGALRAGYTLDGLHENRLSEFEGQHVDIEGVVLQEPDYRENSLLLTVTTDTPTKGVVLVRASRGIHVAYGDTVSFTGTLELPKSFEGTYGRTFAYPEYLRAHGITHTVRAVTLKVEEHRKGNRVLAVLYAFKSKLITSVEKAIPEPAAGLGLGLVLGEKRALGHAWTDIFRVAGLIHIVVLSGYNISIVSEFVMRILSGFLSLKRRLFFGGVAVVLIVLMVGPSASVLRAALMALLVLLARATGKTYELSRALCAAGIVMLIENPLLLAFDPGFQFSFLATLGLIYLAPEIEKRFLFLPTRYQFREFFVATVAAQIMVLPLLLYLTGLFSNVSVIANMLVLPLVPLAMLLTTLTAFIGLFSQIGALLFGYGAYVLLSYILTVAEWLSSFAYSAFEVPQFSFLYVVIAYCFYIVVILVLKKNTAKSKAQLRTPPLVQGVSSEADLYEITVEQKAGDIPFR